MSDSRFHTERVLRSFETLERFDPALRDCVHEFGMAIVQLCLHVGVTDPRRIRVLVHGIWSGARSVGQRGSHPVEVLDWLLPQQTEPISTKAIVGVIHAKGHTIVSRTPTKAMVDASLSALDDEGWVTKQEKHKLRLAAAIRAAEMALIERMGARR